MEDIYNEYTFQTIVFGVCAYLDFASISNAFDLRINFKYLYLVYVCTRFPTNFLLQDPSSGNWSLSFPLPPPSQLIGNPSIFQYKLHKSQKSDFVWTREPSGNASQKKSEKLQFREPLEPHF